MRSISIIMPVRNEAAHIGHTLQCLKFQDFPEDEFEVLVVDGLSDDNTLEEIGKVAEDFPNLKLFFNPRRLSSAARNIGVTHCTGRYIIVVDGHCAIEDRHYLRKLVDAFESSGAETLGRPQPLRHRSPSAFQRCVSLARHSWLGHNPNSDNFSSQAKFVDPQNVAVAYRRDVFDKVGLFDENFDACEDVEFNTRVSRAGLRCWFTPDIAVNYTPRDSFPSLFRQMSRYGRGRFRLSHKHRDCRSLPSLVPPLWLVWMSLWFVAGIIYLPAAWVFAFSLLVYFSIIGVESLRLILGRPEPALLRIPLVFLAIHAGFGWGYLRESCRNYFSAGI